MRQDLTDITIVLDRSGSMHSVRSDTIGGYNKFLADQKSAPGAANVSLMQFDDQFESVYEGRLVAEAPELTTETFIPRGWTALLDAIGRTINRTGARLSATPEVDRPAKVLFIILTDGGENSSKEFTRDKVFEMITHQREAYKWEFLFLGANQDAIKTGAGIGIPSLNAMSYAANAVGTKSAFEATSSNVVTYRSGGSAAYTKADRATQTAAGAVAP
jgi:hypothetical protein